MSNQQSVTLQEALEIVESLPDISKNTLSILFDTD